jgi:Pyridoxamine 5'-phosphate oxidase
VATWAEFESASPQLADLGRRLLMRTGSGEGVLATVRDGGLPRINPVAIDIVDGRLLTFVVATSAKAADLRADGRYALHTHVDLDAPDEFGVRGRGRFVDDEALRRSAVETWAFDASSGYDLVELDIEHALAGRRSNRDEWPPRYTSWRAEGGG